MPYTLANQTAKQLQFPPVNVLGIVPASGSLVVDYVNDEMLAAIDAGLLTCTPALTGLTAYTPTAVAITYNGGGTAAVNNTVPAVTGHSTLLDALACLFREINRLRADAFVVDREIDALKTRQRLV